MIRGGRNYVTSAPAFSNDSKRMFVCSSNSVFIFSTSTGLQIASLEGHSALVTEVIIVPASSHILRYCWTASLDGTIRYWDFSVPELIKTISVKLPIHSMVIPSLLWRATETNEKPAKRFAYISVSDVKESGSEKTSFGKVLKCNLTNSRLVGGVTLAETTAPERIFMSPCRQFFGIKNKRTIYLWKVPSEDSERVAVKRIKLHHTKSITTLAFHPNQNIVAGGDNSGRILLWMKFGKNSFVNDGKITRKIENFNEEKPGVRLDDDADSCTTWHWHSSAINVLNFSSDGAYLYSGGNEGVLVVWQLDTGKKKFLPRIGAPLLFFTFAPDPSLAAMSCADNQIHLTKLPSMEIIKSVSGIKLPCELPDIYKRLNQGVSFNENSGTIALRTGNYSIQLYSLFDDRSITEVQVCERNHHPCDEVTVVVTLVSLSFDGSLMSTVEESLPEGGLGGLVCLRFWAFKSETNVFNLETVVYEPHGLAKVSAVAFHPSLLTAVTASLGGEFKVWTWHKKMNKNDQNECGWSCHAVGSYKGRPMTAACFSHDGSTLAVAAEHLITLWDPYKNILVAVIGQTHSPIGTLSFAGNSGHLISASYGNKPQLCFWSMENLTLLWSLSLKVEAMATRSQHSYFAVLASLNNVDNTARKSQEDGVVLYFDSANPTPSSVWLAKKARGGSIGFISENNTLLEGTNEKALLAFVNADHEFLVFDHLDVDGNQETVLKQQSFVSEEESAYYGYSSIYGKINPKTNEETLFSFAPSERPWENLFAGSSHNLPPLTKLCSVFLSSLLENRT